MRMMSSKCASGESSMPCSAWRRVPAAAICPMERSSVPPRRWARSTTSTRAPCWAAKMAQGKPAEPPPTTIRSQVLARRPADARQHRQRRRRSGALQQLPLVDPKSRGLRRGIKVNFAHSRILPVLFLFYALMSGYSGLVRDHSIRDGAGTIGGSSTVQAAVQVYPASWQRPSMAML